MSRTRGTRRTREDTNGHDDLIDWAEGDTGGTLGIREDTKYARFGTVRHFTYRLMTAKLTANSVHIGGRQRLILDFDG